MTPEHEKLRELSVKADPRPWIVEDDTKDNPDGYHTATRVTGYESDGAPWWIAQHIGEENAEYIVAACNAVPGLLDEGVELRVSLEAEIANNKRLLDENKRSEITLRHLNEAVRGLQSENERLRKALKSARLMCEKAARKCLTPTYMDILWIFNEALERK